MLPGALNDDPGVVLGGAELHRREVEEAFPGDFLPVKDVSPVPECASREGADLLDDLVGRAFEDHEAALTSAGGTEFNDPVGCIEDVKVVFDHQHRMSEADQFVKYANERRRVAKVQSCRRFVEDEELPCAVAAATSERKPLGEGACELEALAFAAGKRGQRLPELQIAEAHFAKLLDSPGDAGVFKEKSRGFICRHV